MYRISDDIERSFIQNTEPSAPTKKSVLLTIVLIAMGAIATFVGAMMILAAQHCLPNALVCFSPIGSMGMGISVVGVGAGLFIAGTTLLLTLILSYRERRSSLILDDMTDSNYLSEGPFDSFATGKIQHKRTQKPTPPPPSYHMLQSLCSFLNTDEWSIHTEGSCNIVLKKSGLRIFSKEKFPTEKGKNVAVEVLQAREKEIHVLQEKLSSGEYFQHPLTEDFYGFAPSIVTSVFTPDEKWTRPKSEKVATIEQDHTAVSYEELKKRSLIPASQSS